MQTYFKGVAGTPGRGLGPGDLQQLHLVPVVVIPKYVYTRGEGSHQAEERILLGLVTL